MVDRIRWDTVSCLPFYYIFFEIDFRFLLLIVFNSQAKMFAIKDILSNLDFKCHEKNHHLSTLPSLLSFFFGEWKLQSRCGCVGSSCVARCCGICFQSLWHLSITFIGKYCEMNFLCVIFKFICNKEMVGPGQSCWRNWLPWQHKMRPSC